MTQKVLGLLLVLFWAACKSDDPYSTEDPPYFVLHYTASNLPEQTVTAGLDSIYLFTDYSIGHDDVVTCVGTFAQVQCLDDTCAGRLSFEFRNTKIGQVALPDSIFRLGEHSFKTTQPSAGQTIYRTTFRADTTFGYTDFLWLFQNQYSAQGSVTTFDFNSSSDSARVELQATRNNGPESRVQRQISFFGPVTAFPSVDLLISPQPTDYRIEAISSGSPISGLSWNNGIALPVFEDTLLQSTYMVTALNFSGSTATASLQGLSPDPGTTQGTANFTHTTTLLTLPPDTLQFGTVTIQWTDDNRKIWRSDQGPQQANSTFKVLETKLYELNEQGQPTWQMQVDFTCILYNQNGQHIPFVGKGLIAVAHP